MWGFSTRPDPAPEDALSFNFGAEPGQESRASNLHGCPNRALFGRTINWRNGAGRGWGWWQFGHRGIGRKSWAAPVLVGGVGNAKRPNQEPYSSRATAGPATVSG